MLASVITNPARAGLAATGRFAFVAGLMCAPWLHGLETQWEQLAFCALCGFALLFAAADQRAFRSLSRNQWQLIIILLSWVFYTLLYLLPLPDTVITVLSPQAATHYRNMLGEGAGYLSLYRHISVVESLKFAALATLFIVISALFAAPHHRRQLVFTLLISVLLTALYSLVNYLTGGAWDWVAAIPPWDYPWSEGIRGTFSYKNQYALLLALSILLGAGLTLDELFPRTGTADDSGLTKSRRLSFALALTVTLIIFVIVLFNTGSRGALVTLVLGGGVAVLPRVVTSRHLLRSHITLKRAALAGVVFVVLAGAFTQTSAFKRFTSDGLQDNGRTLLRQTALAVHRAYPVTGTGPGTYPYVQHEYKPAALGNSAMSKRAHNDYLESLATYGVMGVSLFAVVMAGILFMAFRPHPQASWLLLGARAAMVCYLLQAAIDVTISAFLLPSLFILCAAIAIAENQRLPTQEIVKGGVGR